MRVRTPSFTCDQAPFNQSLRCATNSRKVPQRATSRSCFSPKTKRPRETLLPGPNFPACSESSGTEIRALLLFRSLYRHNHRSNIASLTYGAVGICRQWKYPHSHPPAGEHSLDSCGRPAQIAVVQPPMPLNDKWPRDQGSLSQISVGPIFSIGTKVSERKIRALLK
jgi:hypothetical protein